MAVYQASNRDLIRQDPVLPEEPSKNIVTLPFGLHGLIGNLDCGQNGALKRQILSVDGVSRVTKKAWYNEEDPYELISFHLKTPLSNSDSVDLLAR
ncbi:MAG: hypothetical protein K2X47_02520 [Bdellovibrionales bacterium]|nr:hypothetical protein [Bdellovibrionales bacterium]